MAESNRPRSNLFLDCCVGGSLGYKLGGDGSTWTMVITTPDGTTCMMATGEAWESLAKTAPGQET